MTIPRNVQSALRNAQRPVILADSSCRGLQPELLALAETAKMPMLLTPDALGLVPASHPLYAGHCTFAARPLARAVIAAADLFLLLGGPLSDFGFSGPRSRKGTASFVHCAEHEVALLVDPAPAATWCAPLASALVELERSLRMRSSRAALDWFHEIQSRLAAVAGTEPLSKVAGLIDPRAAVSIISEELPKKCWLCIDIGAVTAHCLEGLSPEAGHQVYLPVERSACMAHPFGASLGIRIASGLPTLAVVGDGAFKMLVEELHTAVEYGSLGGWVVVVFENGGFGMVSSGASQQYGADHGIPCGTWRTPPDWVAVARGFGVEAVSARTPDELRAALRAAFGRPGPVVVVAHIDPDVPPPIEERIKQLGGLHVEGGA